MRTLLVLTVPSKLTVVYIGNLGNGTSIGGCGVIRNRLLI